MGAALPEGVVDHSGVDRQSSMVGTRRGPAVTLGQCRPRRQPTRPRRRLSMWDHGCHDRKLWKFDPRDEGRISKTSDHGCERSTTPSRGATPNGDHSGESARRPRLTGTKARCHPLEPGSKVWDLVVAVGEHTIAAKLRERARSSMLPVRRDRVRKWYSAAASSDSES